MTRNIKRVENAKGLEIALYSETITVLGLLMEKLLFSLNILRT